ncbi:MAG: hypothetical protein ABS95_03400 [Verrucomicrobia bacterium SCN 57-15]|nr:MAG: hypothetical protein ABS95_03400 [Verrucomicrobia bacterium SCN 57-15]
MNTTPSSLFNSASFDRVAWAPVVTFVIWGTCAVIGLAGFVYPYARPTPPPRDTPIQAELINVQLNPVSRVESPRPQLASATVQSVAAPAPAPKVATTIPEAPRLISVADPAKVAFAVPVQPVQRVVTSTESTATVADSNPSAEAAATAGSTDGVARQLTFGEGEGRQPAPEYPYRARKEGQEGIVRVRFTVGQNGRVLEAAPIARSPWRLLNEAALRVIRERWQFSQGETRVYEVSIRFEMRKQDV